MTTYCIADEGRKCHYTAVLNLHANNSVVVLLNEQDQVVYQKRLPNDLPTILEVLAPHHAEIRAWWWNRLTTGTGSLMG